MSKGHPKITTPYMCEGKSAINNMLVKIKDSISLTNIIKDKIYLQRMTEENFQTGSYAHHKHLKTKQIY